MRESNTVEGSGGESNTQEESFIDSNTQETDAESVHSTSDVSMEELNDGEWTSYTDCLDFAMMQAYEDASAELSPSTTVDNMLADDNMLTDEIESDEMESAEPDKVSDLAKKLFRKRLTTNLITLYGLQRDSRFERLFTKIDKYSNDMDLHIAIAMAVKSSKSLIDDDFDDFIRRKVDECSPSDEEESSSSDSSDDE